MRIQFFTLLLLANSGFCSEVDGTALQLNLKLPGTGNEPVSPQMRFGDDPLGPISSRGRRLFQEQAPIVEKAGGKLRYGTRILSYQIDLSNNDNIDNSLSQLQKLRLPEIEGLDLRDTKTSRNTLRLVTEFTLKIHLLLLDNTNCTGDALKSLATLQVEELSLTNVAITDNDLAQIRSNHLRSLVLSGTNISKDCGVHLTKCINLVNLNLSDTNVDDSTIEAISKMNIWCLSVQGTKISSKSLKYFARMPKLQLLDLTGTNITKDQIRNFETNINKRIRILCK